MTQTNTKQFRAWITRKAEIHYAARLPRIKEGQVWWAAVGENVGAEINGKGEKFSRPVVIVKKLCRTSFLGVPLTSKPHTGSWYVNFVFLGRQEFAALSQIRTFSTFRLYRKMGELPEKDLATIKRGFNKLYK